MKISFAITVHNEGDCLEELLTQLRTFIEDNDTEDEIVLLDDHSDDPDTVRILESHSMESYISLHRRRLNRDFGAQKSYLNTLCKGDFIFQIDADEILAPGLLENLREILEAHSQIDLFFVPRVNTVENLTEEHIQQWNWKVNENGWVMWPDYQTRIYRNDPEIMWTGKVHERVQGHTSYARLPEDESFAILHHKHIDRQEAQNVFYDQIAQES